MCSDLLKWSVCHFHSDRRFRVCPGDTTRLQAPYGSGLSNWEMRSWYSPVPIGFHRKLALKVAQVKIFPLSALRGKELFPEVLNAVYCFSCFSIRYIWQLRLLGFYPSVSQTPRLFIRGIKRIFQDQPLTHCCQWEQKKSNLQFWGMIFDF